MRPLTILTTLAALAASPSAAEAQFLADLVPTYLKWSAGFAPGGRVTLDSTIKNAGVWPSSSCSSGYYLSTDSTITTGDMLLASFTTPGIGIQGSTKHQTTITVPQNVGAGTCYIGVFADHNNALGEVSNTNNTLAGKTTCYGMPNLYVSNISVSTKWIERGRTVVMTSTHANSGGVTSGACSVGYYLSSNSTISTGDRLLTTKALGALSSGRSSGWSTNLVIPMDAAIGVDCWLGAYVDYAGQVSEISEADNGAGVQVRCYAQGLFSSFGKACPGRAGTSAHTATNSNGGPYINTTTSYKLTNGPRNFVSVFMLGASRDSWNSIPLPFALDVIGAPNCFLNVTPDILLSIGTNAAGDGQIDLKHPNEARFIGTSYYTQFANVEFGFNALGLTYSNGVQTMLGVL